MHRVSQRVHRHAGRRGFTLVELLIAMTMLAVIGTAVVSVLNRQQRFSRAAADLGAMRTQLQTITSVLSGDLRSVSAVGGDIIRMTDSSVHVRTTIATSVICSVSGHTIMLAPLDSVSSPVPAKFGPGPVKVRMTSMLLEPDKSMDSAFVWSEENNRWAADAGTPGRPYQITNVVQSVGGCPSILGMTAPTGSVSFALTLDADMSTFPVGAPVQVVRHVSYGLYKSGVDGQWYLGYRDPTFTAQQFVAGPLGPYVADSKSGLHFTYFDTLGTKLTVGSTPVTAYAQTSRVGRIEFNVNAVTTAPGSLAGATVGAVQKDSLRVGVALRNRVPQ